MALFLLFDNELVLGLALALIETYERASCHSGDSVGLGRCLSLALNLVMYLGGLSFRAQCLLLLVLSALLPDKEPKIFVPSNRSRSWKEIGLIVSRILLGVYTSHWTQRLLNNKAQALLAVSAIYFALQMTNCLSPPNKLWLLSAALLLLALLHVGLLANPLLYLLLFLLINLTLRVNEPKNCCTSFFEVVMGFAILGRLEVGAEWRGWLSSWALGLASLTL